MSQRVGSLVALTAVLAIAVLAAPGHAHAGALTPQEEKLVAAAKKKGICVLRPVPGEAPAIPGRPVTPEARAALEAIAELVQVTLRQSGGASR